MRNALDITLPTHAPEKPLFGGFQLPKFIRRWISGRKLAKELEAGRREYKEGKTTSFTSWDDLRRG